MSQCETGVEFTTIGKGLNAMLMCRAVPYVCTEIVLCMTASNTDKPHCSGLGLGCRLGAKMSLMHTQVVSTRQAHQVFRGKAWGFRDLPGAAV